MYFYFYVDSLHCSVPCLYKNDTMPDNIMYHWWVYAIVYVQMCVFCMYKLLVCVCRNVCIHQEQTSLLCCKQQNGKLFQKQRGQTLVRNSSKCPSNCIDAVHN